MEGQENVINLLIAPILNIEYNSYNDFAVQLGHSEENIVGIVQKIPETGSRQAELDNFKGNDFLLSTIGGFLGQFWGFHLFIVQTSLLKACVLVFVGYFGLE